MIMADKIMQQRKKCGWSQEELAEKLGVSRQSVSKWEGAQATPDLGRIQEMSRLFGVTTDYLIKEELTEAEPAPESNADLPVRRVSMEEANAFLLAKDQSALRIALAVFLCILSPVCLLFLGAASEAGVLSLSENAAGGIGLGVLILLVACGVAVMVTSGIRLQRYEYLGKGVL